MQVTLIRHATILVNYAGKNILVDPMLDAKGARPAIPNTDNPQLNPLVDLPEGWELIVESADAIIQTHLHSDHFDDTAKAVLDKSLPVFCLPEQVAQIDANGFLDIRAVETTVTWDGIRLTRIGGQHGTGEIGAMLAPVSGWILQAPGEPVAYLAGDTIWCDEVAAAIATYAPSAIVLNAGGAQFQAGGLIIMDSADIAKVRDAAPDAAIAVVHLNAINHCFETRELLQANLASLGVGGVVIPEDGETISF
jgi:L-ascorbate metabolism protein UlaG (beta-lactamase superfamily)